MFTFVSKHVSKALFMDCDHVYRKCRDRHVLLKGNCYPASSAPVLLVVGVAMGSPVLVSGWVLTQEWRNGTRALPSSICVGWYTSRGRVMRLRWSESANTILRIGTPAGIRSAQWNLSIVVTIWEGHPSIKATFASPNTAFSIHLALYKEATLYSGHYRQVSLYYRNLVFSSPSVKDLWVEQKRIAMMSFLV